MKFKSISLALLFSLLSIFPLIASAQEEQEKPKKDEPTPKATDLLPQDTVLLVQAEDINDLYDKFSETSFGKMVQDEKLAPLLGGVYDSFNQLFEENVAGELGASLDDLRSLPKGQISFALAAPRRQDMSPVFILEVGDDNEVANTLLDRGRELVQAEEGTETEEIIGDTSVYRFEGDSDDEQVMYFQRAGLLVFCTDIEMATNIINRWDGETPKRDRPLSQNRKFLNVMAQCNGTKDERPQIQVYIDPIELYRKTTRGNAGATIALGFIRSLGLDGFSAVGMGAIFAPEDFDSIFHFHVGLTSPRSGIIEMIAIKSGDVTPEIWVPNTVGSYMTMNWDYDKTYNELVKLYDSFYEPGDMESLIDENVNDRIEMDLKEDILSKLNGRVSLAQMYTQKGAINAQSTMIGVGLENGEKFKDTLESLVKAIDEDGSWKTSRHLGSTIYSLEVDNEGRRAEIERRRAERRAEIELTEDQQARREARDKMRKAFSANVRTPEPCFAIVKDHFLLSDSIDFLKEAIKTSKNDDRGLAQDTTYKQVIKQIRRQLDGKEPGMITYQRPEESFRMIYDLVENDATKETLKAGAEQWEFARNMSEAFENSELPEFEHFLQYMAPTGGMLTNDESGIHYMAFSLKSEANSSKKKKKK